MCSLFNIRTVQKMKFSIRDFFISCAVSDFQTKENELVNKGTVHVHQDLEKSL